MKKPILPFILVFARITFGDGAEPEKAYLDAILERGGAPSPQQIEALDLTGPGGLPDGQIDIRDLAVFFEGLPVSASFGRAESIVFASKDSPVVVSLPMYFSKPIQGVISFNLGGNALSSGSNRVVTLLQSEIHLGEPATTAELGILIHPWDGFGGEKIVRISLQRDPGVVPANGTFPSHLLRIRQFDAGEFTGMLTFPPASGLSALPVRIGLDSSGAALCSFQDPGSLLGEVLAFSWTAGFEGFPNLNGSASVVIPKETFNRTQDLAATLTFQRMAAPFPDDLEALLEGFPSEAQPAVYHARLVFPDLFAAGAAPGGGPHSPYAITYEGRLVISLAASSETP